MLLLRWPLSELIISLPSLIHDAGSIREYHLGHIGEWEERRWWAGPRSNVGLSQISGFRHSPFYASKAPSKSPKMKKNFVSIVFFVQGGYVIRMRRGHVYALDTGS